MSVIATINIGRNGATSKGGSSPALSSAADRERFLALHRSAGSYLLGRNSFLAERYHGNSRPIYIISRSAAPIPGADVNVQVITEDSLIESARKIYRIAPHPIVVEAGVSLLLSLIESGSIEELELSISPIDGDGDFIEAAEILKHFRIVEDIDIAGTRLLKCRYQGDSAYRESDS